LIDLLAKREKVKVGQQEKQSISTHTKAGDQKPAAKGMSQQSVYDALMNSSSTCAFVDLLL
jgi:hypothetical protein